MPLSSEPALQRAIQLITQAQASLQEAEALFHGDLAGILGNENYPDAIRFEEVLGGATHEMAGTLGMYLHEIKSLLPRVELRRKYPKLTNEEFETIVSQDWSVSIVQQMYELMQNKEHTTLADVSGLIKTIQQEWSRIQI